MRYLAGISDGMYWCAGGSTTIEADSIADAMRQAEDWSDEGDYPVSPDDPPAVELSLRIPVSPDERLVDSCLRRLHAQPPDSHVLARWTHVVPATACSGGD